jgi:hypothetical protein
VKRAITAAAILTGLPLTTLIMNSPPASAAPPPPPGPTTAKSELAALKVKKEISLSGYSRTKFPHWTDQGFGCSTRELVLMRDGKGVRVGSDCYPTRGTWYSPYDGKTVTSPHKVDIEHRREVLEYGKAPVVRQRPAPRGAVDIRPPAQHGQGWQGPGPLAAAAQGVPLHVRPLVRTREVRLEPVGEHHREEGPHLPAQDLLTRGQDHGA